MGNITKIKIGDTTYDVGYDPTSLENRISHVEETLTDVLNDISDVETSLLNNIAAVETRLLDNITDVETSLLNDISDVETSLNNYKGRLINPNSLPENPEKGEIVYLDSGSYTITNGETLLVTLPGWYKCVQTERTVYKVSAYASNNLITFLYTPFDPAAWWNGTPFYPTEECSGDYISFTLTHVVINAAGHIYGATAEYDCDYDWQWTPSNDNVRRAFFNIERLELEDSIQKPLVVWRPLKPEFVTVVPQYITTNVRQYVDPSVLWLIGKKLYLSCWLGPCNYTLPDFDAGDAIKPVDRALWKYRPTTSGMVPQSLSYAVGDVVHTGISVNGYEAELPSTIYKVTEAATLTSDLSISEIAEPIGVIRAAALKNNTLYYIYADLDVELPPLPYNTYLGETPIDYTYLYFRNVTIIVKNTTSDTINVSLDLGDLVYNGSAWEYPEAISVPADKQAIIKLNPEFSYSIIDQPT